MNEVTFSIEVTMKERWVDDFCSMLRYMERCGRGGHSALVGFYADGDGDFRPNFVFGRKFEEKPGIPQKDILAKPEVMFDAG